MGPPSLFCPTSTVAQADHSASLNLHWSLCGEHLGVGEGRGSCWPLSSPLGSVPHRVMLGLGVSKTSAPRSSHSSTEEMLSCP